MARVSHIRPPRNKDRGTVVNWVSLPVAFYDDLPADGTSLNYITLSVDNGDMPIKVDVTVAKEPAPSDLTFWPRWDWQNAYAPGADLTTNDGGFLGFYVTCATGQPRTYTLTFSSGSSDWSLPPKSVDITFTQPAAAAHAPLQVSSFDYPATDYYAQPVPILSWPSGSTATPVRLNIQGDQAKNASFSGSLTSPYSPQDDSLGTAGPVSSDGDGNLTITAVPTRTYNHPVLLTLTAGTGEKGAIWLQATEFGTIYLYSNDTWPPAANSTFTILASIAQLTETTNQQWPQVTPNPSGLTLEWRAGDDESSPFFAAPQKVTTDHNDPSTFQYQTKPISQDALNTADFHIAVELRIYDDKDNYFSVTNVWGQTAPPPSNTLTIVQSDGTSICTSGTQTTTRTVQITQDGKPVDTKSFTGTFFPQGQPGQTQPLTLLHGGVSDGNGMLSFNALPAKSGTYVLSLTRSDNNAGGDANYTAQVLTTVVIQSDPDTATVPLPNGVTLTANITDDNAQQYPGGLTLQWESDDADSDKFFSPPRKTVTREGDVSSFQYQTNPITAQDLQTLSQLAAKLEIFADSTSIVFSHTVPFAPNTSGGNLTITPLNGTDVVALADPTAANATPMQVTVNKQGNPQANQPFIGTLTLKADGSDAGTAHLLQPISDPKGGLTVIPLANVQGNLELRLTNTQTGEYGTLDIDATVLQSIVITPSPTMVEEPQPQGITLTADITSFLGVDDPDGLMLSWAGADDSSQKFFNTQTVTTQHGDPTTFQCQTNPIAQADLDAMSGIQAVLQVHSAQSYFTVPTSVPFATKYPLAPPKFTLNDQDILDPNAWLAAEKNGGVPFWIGPMQGITGSQRSTTEPLGAATRGNGGAILDGARARLNLWGQPPQQARTIMCSEPLSDDDINNGVYADVSLDHSLFEVNQRGIAVYYEVMGPKINTSRSGPTWLTVHRMDTEQNLPGTLDTHFIANATPRQYLKAAYEAQRILSVDAYIPRGALPQVGDLITVYLDLSGYTDQNSYDPQPRLQLKPYALLQDDIDREVPQLGDWVVVSFADSSGPKAGFASGQFANIDGCNGALYFLYEQTGVEQKRAKACPIIVDVTADPADVPEDFARWRRENRQG